jgi:subtilase family serine protease
MYKGAFVNGSLKLLAPLVVALALAACNAGGSTNIPGSAGAAQNHAPASHAPASHSVADLARVTCPQVAHEPSCLAVVDTHAKPNCTGASCGFTPAQLETAYAITSDLGNGTGQKVAVVEAGDEPDAATALSTYRSTFGLSTATFYKFNQKGQQYDYPPSCEDYGWCVETDLDIEMISASCPNCTIYLMEAGGSISDFEQAESEAVTLGATIVSNSWSCPEDWDCEDTNFPNYFDTSGIAYLASTGDYDYNTIGGPSDLASVIGVGGTQLHKAASGYTQTVWNQGGGEGASAGCASPGVVGSPGVPKPSWQHDPDCTYRTDGDVSAQAGLSPGVAEYIGIYAEWIDVGGTSVASPFTAGVIGLAGNATTLGSGGDHFWSMTKKQHKNDFLLVLSGNDGSCGDEYLCTAGLKKKHGGYDTYSGPGGWGSPKGITAY